MRLFWGSFQTLCSFDNTVNKSSVYSLTRENYSNRCNLRGSMSINLRTHGQKSIIETLSCLLSSLHSFSYMTETLTMLLHLSFRKRHSLSTNYLSRLKHAFRNTRAFVLLPKILRLVMDGGLFCSFSFQLQWKGGGLISMQMTRICLDFLLELLLS